MLNFLILTKILHSFLTIDPTSLEQTASTLLQGEKIWVKGKLSDSYDNLILEDIGLPACGGSVHEYRIAFNELNLEVEHLEIKREMLRFGGIEQLQQWIRSQVEGDFLAPLYWSAMQKKEWVSAADGSIGFPTKYLIACIKKTK